MANQHDELINVPAFVDEFGNYMTGGDAPRLLGRSPPPGPGPIPMPGGTFIVSFGEHPPGQGPSETVQAALQFLSEVGAMLIEKNRKYGDSAANPKRIFSRADPLEQMRVRIDDKLSRIATMGDQRADDEDTSFDLVGYLALYEGAKRTKKAAPK